MLGRKTDLREQNPFYNILIKTRKITWDHRTCQLSSACPGRVHRPRRAQKSGSYESSIIHLCFPLVPVTQNVPFFVMGAKIVQIHYINFRGQIMHVMNFFAPMKITGTFFYRYISLRVFINILYDICSPKSLNFFASQSVSLSSEHSTLGIIKPT
jgi:hypothetical protein